MVSTGDPLTVRLSYDAAAPIREVSFSIRLETPSGLPVMTASSGVECTWEVSQGSGTVEFAMDECLLAPGSYLLKTEISAGGSVVDSDDAGTVVSIRNAPFDLEGMYRQPGVWSKVG